MTTLFETLEADVQTAINNFEQFWDSKVWPYIKAGLSLLASQEGKVAVDAAVAEVPEIVTGNEAAAGLAVLGAVTATLAANATSDAEAEIAKAEAGAPADPAEDPNAPSASSTITSDAEAAAPVDSAPDGEQTNPPVSVPD